MSEKKWYDNEISMGIMTRKYLHEGEKPEEFIPRLASIFSDEIKDDAYTLLDNVWFLPAGRTLFGAGYKGERKVSLSNCFPAGMQVLTTAGFKPIEYVTIGDMVITSQGPRRVNNVMSRPYQGDLFVIKSRQLLADIVCTPNHQFLTNEGWLRADRLHATAKGRPAYKLKFLEHKFQKMYPVIDLFSYYENTKRDRAVQVIDPTNMGLYHETYYNNRWNRYGSNEVNRYIELTEEFRYFIGRWIGDGSITRRKDKRDYSILQIVFNATTERDAAERCIRIGTQTFGIMPSVRENHNQNTYIVRWENPIIGNFFYREFGAGCEGKHIPPMYLGDMAIAMGMLDSDGCVLPSGGVSITLKNLGLIQWLKVTLAMNGIKTNPISSGANHNTAHFLQIATDASRKYILPYLTRKYDDGRQNAVGSVSEANWVRVEQVNIIENANTFVFNLSVDEVHEYNVNGVICHNCYVQGNIPKDNLESIFDTAKDMARIFSYGGGAGIAIDNLRPKGAKVNNSAMESSGAVSFLNVFDTVGAVIGQNGRRAAIMVALTCEHPDITEFLRIKEENEKLAFMNISIKFTDEFMKAVEKNEKFTLHFENDVVPRMEKEIDAREFFMEFCECQRRMGDPKYSWAA